MMLGSTSLFCSGGREGSRARWSVAFRVGFFILYASPDTPGVRHPIQVDRLADSLWSTPHGNFRANF